MLADKFAWPGSSLSSGSAVPASMLPSKSVSRFPAVGYTELSKAASMSAIWPARFMPDRKIPAITGPEVTDFSLITSGSVFLGRLPAIIVTTHIHFNCSFVFSH